MATDDELIATKLLAMLNEKYPLLNVSESTVKRVRVELGWAAKKTRYRQRKLATILVML